MDSGSGCWHGQGRLWCGERSLEGAGAAIKAAARRWQPALQQGRSQAPENRDDCDSHSDAAPITRKAWLWRLQALLCCGVEQRLSAARRCDAAVPDGRGGLGWALAAWGSSRSRARFYQLRAPRVLVGCARPSLGDCLCCSDHSQRRCAPSNSQFTCTLTGACNH
jgi:hypothetical protein